MGWPSTASVCVATAVVAVTLLAPGCSRTAPGPVDTDCTKATLTPGPCNEPFSEGPDPIVPETRCPTLAEIEAIYQDVPVMVAADATQGTLVCRAADGSVDLTPARAAIFRGLMFMKRVRFDAPLPWTSETLYDWVRNAIPNGIVIIASGNSHACLNCAGPIYIAWNPGQRSAGLDVISAVSIIVHETRHTDNMPHTCPGSSGAITLDRTIKEMGAMGADYYVREWIATHSDEHPDTREYSRKSAARLRRSFCCECPRQTFAGPPVVELLANLLSPPSVRRASACGV